MNVYTYYKPVQSLADEGLLELWANSWKSYGFKPVVLYEEDTKNHPDAHYVWTCPYFGKTCNVPDYERACFMRWLAVQQFGGGLMSDWDVLNYGLTPDDFKEALQDTEKLVFFGGGVPCLVYGTPPAYQTAIRLFIAYAEADRPVNLGNVSDMHIFMENPELMKKLEWVVEYGKPGWKKANLVHYANSKTRPDRNKERRSTWIPKQRQ